MTTLMFDFRDSALESARCLAYLRDKAMYGPTPEQHRLCMLTRRLLQTRKLIWPLPCSRAYVTDLPDSRELPQQHMQFEAVVKWNTSQQRKCLDAGDYQAASCEALERMKNATAFQQTCKRSCKVLSQLQSFFRHSNQMLPIC